MDAIGEDASEKMYEHCCVSAGADVWIHWRIKHFFRRVPLPSSFLIHWLTWIDWTIVLLKFNNFLILTTRWLELAYEKSIFSLPPSSVADPYRYHFDTDPDQEPDKNSLWIQTKLWYGSGKCTRKMLKLW